MIEAVEETVRLGVCLVHAVPGAAAVVQTRCGERFVVAHHRLDALLDPCQLRAALLAERSAGVPHLADTIVHFEIVGGMVDIGGGLYQRSHPAAEDERWFATTLTSASIAELTIGCPLGLPDGCMDVSMRTDTGLGAVAVCLTALAGFACHLDEVANWLHARCLVGELISQAERSYGR